MLRWLGSLVFLVACGWALAGCETPPGTVQLVEPPDGAAVWVGNKPGPAFRWRVEGGDPQAGLRYRLTVHTPEGPYQAAISGAKQHEIEEDEGSWLLSQQTYQWEVAAEVLDEDANVVETYPCAGPRSFTVDQRDQVRIRFGTNQLEPPPGTEPAVVILVDQDRLTDNALEVDEGDRREVVIRATFDSPTVELDGVEYELERVEGDKGRLTINGVLHVLTANDNTRDGTQVLINDLKFRELCMIYSQGKIGRHVYLLGGEEVVELWLGARGELRR